MPLKLGRALKREVDIHGTAYTVTVSPLGVRLVRKGFRKGVAVSWRRLLQMAAGEPGPPDAAAPAGAPPDDPDPDGAGG